MAPLKSRNGEAFLKSGSSAGACVRGSGHFVLNLLMRSLELLTCTSLVRTGAGNSVSRILYDLLSSVPSVRWVFAVDDKHGHPGLLRRLIGLLCQDTGRRKFSGRPILVGPGDDIGRGFQRHEAISTLLSDALSFFGTCFLKGSHETARDQLQRDTFHCLVRAQCTVAEMHISQRINFTCLRTSPVKWDSAHTGWRDALLSDHCRMPTGPGPTICPGEDVLVHAGIRPGQTSGQSSEAYRIGSRDAFIPDRSSPAAVMINGYSPKPLPCRNRRRIGIDSGVHLSGRLMAARFKHAKVKCVSARPIRTPVPA